MAHRAKPPRPITRRAASLHADRARLDLGEEFDDPRRAQSAFRGGTIFALQRLDLKQFLAMSTPIRIYFRMDGLPLGGGPATTFRHLDAPQAGPSTPSRRSRGSSVYRRLGMPAFSARSLALDGVSLGAGRQGDWPLAIKSTPSSAPPSGVAPCGSAASSSGRDIRAQREPRLPKAPRVSSPCLEQILRESRVVRNLA